MKVTAYKTECCGKIMDEEHILGIIRTPDIFVKYTYKTVAPRMANVHFCTECYNNMVSEPANAQAPKRIDRDKYQEKVLELTYNFRKILFKDLAG